MFACIFGLTVPTFGFQGNSREALLINLAFTFSPLVEKTAVDTVVLDISGQELLFGAAGNQLVPDAAEIDSSRNIAEEITRQASRLDFKVNVSVAANPDVAIHAARSFKGVTVVSAGEEHSQLGSLSLKILDYSLAGIQKERVEEIRETLALWGLRTFSDLARLPMKGVAERLGQEGVKLQQLTQGKTERHLLLVRPPKGFEQSLELEHPVAELEPLSFILSRLLNQLCANLHTHALATNELRLCLKLEDKTEHQRTITLPVPMLNPKTFLRLLLFDIELQPPQAAISAVTIVAEPAKPRVSQTGLFTPLTPEPEKLEITLARLTKLVGPNNVGSPELLDTHRPDAFRMKRFKIAASHKKTISNPPSSISNSHCVMGFRMFRPCWRAEVQTMDGQPVRINARGANSAWALRGKIICAAGPWRASGDWWRPDVWARDEWDVAVAEADPKQSNVVCRIYRDLQSEEWFVEGVYD